VKVTEDQERLVLVDFDWWWACGAITSFLCFVWHMTGSPKGIILTAMPLIVWGGFCGCFLWLSTRSHFIFDKSKAELRWSRMGIFGREQGTIPFADFRTATIRTEWSDLDFPTERIVLVTKSQQLPIQTGFSLDSQESQRATLVRIRQAVADARKLPKNTPTSRP
jgi:hypothetical protein